MVVQINGIADVDTPVRDRLSGVLVVYSGSPTLTVPDEPAVIVPVTDPGTDTKTLPVGKVAGTTKVPDMFRVGVPVPPVTVRGVDPANPMVDPGVVSPSRAVGN